jgi:hypothetical protein
MTSELWEEFDAAAKAVEAWPNIRCVYICLCVCVCVNSLCNLRIV